MSAPPTLGIEEEFVFLDEGTLSTTDAASDAVSALRATHDSHVKNEFHESQIEYATPVAADLRDAGRHLAGFRADLGRWAHENAVIVVSSGTPFRVSQGSRLHVDERYSDIAASVAHLSDEHHINGMHVHVGVAGEAAGVRASDALRPWLPVLLALSSNSPFWQGCDTGYASWRALHSRRWTSYGVPPRFVTAAAHTRARQVLRGVGATTDDGTVNWSVRLSAVHPTVETRVCDGQLDVSSTLALAALVRALVSSAGDASVPRERAPGLWDAALWHAARHGVSADLVDPPTGRMAPARLAVVSLRRHVARQLRESGDGGIVDRSLRRVLRDGSGAAAQWRAGRNGLAALAELYRERLESAY